MASLTGASIASSYTSLLKLNGNTDTLADGTGSNAIQVVDGDGTGSPLYLNTDRLGIGTSPTTSLTITGAQSSTIGNLSISSNNYTSSGITLFNTSSGSPHANSRKWGIMTNYAGEGDFQIRRSSSNTGNLDTYALSITKDSNVGIGNAFPAVSMHINKTAPTGIAKADSFLHLGVAVGNAERATISFGYSGGTNIPAAISYKNTNNGGSTTGELGFFTRSGTSDVAPLEVMTLDANSRISLSNNDLGTSNTIFGKNAGNNAVSGSIENVFIGEDSAGTGSRHADADGNVGVGFKTLEDLTEGQYNVAIGRQSSLNITTGDKNIAIGGGTLAVATTASSIVAIGHDAAYSVSASSTAANGTVAIGDSALNALTIGTSNIAIGQNSLTALTIGVSNTAVGYYGLSEEVGGGNSTSIGNGALGKSNGGSSATLMDNTGVGVNSGFHNVTGTKNTYLGSHAGFGATGESNSSNTGVGYKALFGLTTGTNNTVIGSNAATAMDTESNNTVIGQDAFNGGINGADSCVVIGKSAVASAHTQDGTVAVGASALGVCTTGAGNIAIGFEAGKGIIGSGNNTAIGYQSILSLARYDTQNVAVGNYSLDHITEDAYNTAIGYDALTNQRTTNAGALQASYNTALGWKAGDALVGNNSTGGKKNTFLGASTDADDTEGFNQTVVGYGATGQGDNSVTLGDVDVTAVYMAQDKGAKIYAGNAQFMSPDNTGHLTVDLWADQGETNADKWRIEIEDGADFTIESFTSGSWVEKLAIANDGTFTGSSSNDISDERLKENIKNITGGLDAINKLQGRTFNWKKSADMNTRTNYGLIAQEVEKVIPELIYEKGGIRELTPEVLYSEKDTIPSDKKINDVKEKATYYKSLNTSGLVPVLIEAVKELSAKVTELESKLK